MVRVIYHRQKWSVYVNRSVGEQHHLPHAHIVRRGHRVATVYLMTLMYEFVIEALPKSLYEEISARQDELLDRWEELNA
jgi:hypothetical protein